MTSADITVRDFKGTKFRHLFDDLVLYRVISEMKTKSPPIKEESKR